MLSVTTLEGKTLIGRDRIELASMLADHELGAEWEAQQPPFIDHSVTWECVEALELYDLRPADDS